MPCGNFLTFGISNFRHFRTLPGAKRRAEFLLRNFLPKYFGIPVCLIDITGTIIANKMVAAGYGLLLTSFFFNVFIFQRPSFSTSLFFNVSAEGAMF